MWSLNAFAIISRVKIAPGAWRSLLWNSCEKSSFAEEDARIGEELFVKARAVLDVDLDAGPWIRLFDPLLEEEAPPVNLWVTGGFRTAVD